MQSMLIFLRLVRGIQKFKILDLLSLLMQQFCVREEKKVTMANTPEAKFLVSVYSKLKFNCNPTVLN